jgi:membrane-bound serine protease (ClpP class)
MNLKHTFLFLLILVTMALGGGMAGAGQGEVYVMTLSGSINPGSAYFVKNCIQTAENDAAACLVIELDTPGGLSESMRSIVQDILGADIPVIVYVHPAGARAASAGVMITMAADIAAMAPGTNIGAAHPVNAGGKEIEETLSEKVVNDMVAHARSVAEKRGRNARWVERAIRESVSVTETEALGENIVDVVAEDLPDLISKVNGRDLGEKGALSLDADRIRRLNEDIRTRVFRAIGDPNIAYILMMIGLAGLYFELAHPGAVLPGVVGALCLVLSFFAFQTLPVNYTGMLLILLAIIFFILELKVTSFGMLTIAGVVSMLLGSMMLYESGAGGVQLSLRVLFVTVGAVSAFFMVLAYLVVRAHAIRPRTGPEGLIGEEGVVKEALTPEGKVLVHGELWWAKAPSSIDAGIRVKVVGVRGLVMDVKRAEDGYQRSEVGDQRSEV